MAPSVVAFVLAALPARSPRAEGKGSVLTAQQHQCEPEKKALSTSAIVDGLLSFPFFDAPMVGYTCRASSVAASCPGLVGAGLDSSRAWSGRDWSGLLIPLNTHLLFHGPSYLSEIHTTTAAANMHVCVKAVCLLPAGLSVPCSPHGCPEITDCRAQRYEYCNGATLTHIGFLDGSPRLDDDVVNGLLDEWRATFPDRAHAFGMIGHGRAYFDEKDNAGKEKRHLNIDNFLDAEGQDMCIPGGGAFSGDVTLNASGYLECAARMATWSHMAHSIENATLVVPWHITPPDTCSPTPIRRRQRARPSPSPSPSPAPSPSPSPFPSLSLSPSPRHVYFTRCLVAQHDCRIIEPKSNRIQRKALEKIAASRRCVREWQTEISEWFSPPRDATEGDCSYACRERSTWCVGYEFAPEAGGTCKLYDDDCTNSGHCVREWQTEISNWFSPPRDAAEDDCSYACINARSTWCVGYEFTPAGGGTCKLYDNCASRDERDTEIERGFLMSAKAGTGIAGHQCAAVCEGEQGPVVTASSGCSRVYAGSIFLIAEELLQLVR